MSTPAEDDGQKIAELRAIVETVRDRVRQRYPRAGEASQSPATGGVDGGPAIQIGVADLTPILHARDRAQAKIAAIGSVNPRRGGALNRGVQSVKRGIARGLQWFVRDQVTFNQDVVGAIEAVIEALNDHNRILLALAGQANDQIESARKEIAGRTEELSARIDALAKELAESVTGEVQELKDMRKHWIEWRGAWEQKLATNEIQFLRGVADLQGAFQHRSTLMETNFRQIVQAQHSDYLGALDRANLDIQKRLWADLQKVKEQYERLIFTELRLIRQRLAPREASVSVAPPPPSDSSASAPQLDYARFAERFRGSEEHIRAGLEFYQKLFEGRENVLDIVCGRGEFLELMRDAGVPARGIDLSAESVALCRNKGLNVEAADLFPWLQAQPEWQFDGIFCSQVVEHLEPERLPEMLQLCASRLRKGGLLAIETPNPECLAIFATHFYLDPTHKRPVPHPLLEFYMREAGLSDIEVHRLSPAIDSEPEIGELPEGFRNRFFGGLDYAILGRRL